MQACDAFPEPFWDAHSVEVEAGQVVHTFGRVGEAMGMRAELTGLGHRESKIPGNGHSGTHASQSQDSVTGVPCAVSWERGLPGGLERSCDELPCERACEMELWR